MEPVLSFQLFSPGQFCKVRESELCCHCGLAMVPGCIQCLWCYLLAQRETSLSCRDCVWLSAGGGGGLAVGWQVTAGQGEAPTFEKMLAYLLDISLLSQFNQAGNLS